MTTAAATTPNQVVSGTTTVPAGTSTKTPNATLAGNFQTFLTILTTQLQNQNPLDPLDTNQFTQQLVQFAGVEQQLRTNDQLSSLVSLQQTQQSTQALEFVGKTATVDGSSTRLTSGAASWNVNLDQDATVDISIANSVGQTVYTGQFPVAAGQNQAFNWDGKGNDGAQWPDGAYTMTATAKNATGNTVAVNTQTSGTVSSVDLTQTPPLLTINGQTYTMNQIKGVKG